MIITRPDQLAELESFISENTHLAFDIETTGLSVHKDKIIGFGISNAEKGYYVCHMDFDKHSKKLLEVISHAQCVNLLNLLLNKKLITFNGSFDTRFTMEYFGVNLINNIWSDAMLAKHTVDEERPFGLKDIAKKLFGDSATDEQAKMQKSIKDNGGSAKEYYKADLQLMGEYCIADCKLTFRVNDHYLEKIEREKLADFYFKDEVMPMYTLVTIPMELKGVAVDVPLIQKAHNDIVRDLNSLEYKIQSRIACHLYEFEQWFLNKELPPRRSGEFAQQLCKFANLDLPKTNSGRYSISAKALNDLPDSDYKNFLLHDGLLTEDIIEKVQRQWWGESEPDEYMFNLLSKHHLKKLFFEKLGETAITKTPTGQPQVNDLFLESVASKYEWVPMLQQYNKLTKLKGTYIDRILERQIDGMLYPSWNMHRTTSGRLGGDLMQLPRPLEKDEAPYLIRKYNNIIRSFIIAGDNKKLVGADYASLEVVVFADDAGDKALLNMIKEGRDFYSTVAIDVQGIEGASANKKADNYLKVVNAKARQDAKSYSLGIRYGMQAFKLSKELDIPMKQAENIVDKYFKTYPRLKTRMDQLIKQATELGYVKSKGGRIRHLSMLKKLHYSHGEDLADSLKLWSKYHDCPKEYSRMKYLSKQYKNLRNNCLNFPIQSMAATITNKSCIALAREFKRQGLSAYVCMQIHDEIVVRCSEHETDRVSKLMKFIMENTTKLSVPLSAEPEIGDKYSDIK